MRSQTEGRDTVAATDNTFAPAQAVRPALRRGSHDSKQSQCRNGAEPRQRIRKTLPLGEEVPGILQPVLLQLWRAQDRASSECSGQKTAKKRDSLRKQQTTDTFCHVTKARESGVAVEARGKAGGNTHSNLTLGKGHYYSYV